MKITSFPLVLAAAIAAACTTLAGESDKPYTGSAEFEKLKTLAGTWQGTTDMGAGPMTVSAVYRVTSGGSAVEERLFADTPKEMVTIYHDKDGKAALTHYCMLCNRPSMTLVKGGEKTISFDLAKDCGIDAEKEKHMHALTLTFDDANHFSQEWTMYDGGKAQGQHVFKFERVK